jgi:hypothetical protein
MAEADMTATAVTATDVAAASVAAKRGCAGGSERRNTERGDRGQSEEGTTVQHGKSPEGLMWVIRTLVETFAGRVHGTSEKSAP